MMQSETLPTLLKLIPAPSLHSTTAPLIETLAVATAVELKMAPGIISVTPWNVKGPHGSVEMGGLWSINVIQSTGELLIHLVTPLAALLWLHVIVMLLPAQAVSTPPT